MATNKYDVFISYSRADYKDENNVPIPNNVISKILSAFKKNNISYWIDESGIYTGDNFAPKIAEAIKNASVFVFVSTENSNSSKWTQNEVCVAQSYKKPILPIKCDESAYAVSVIMYLAMLDYCDYKNFPDSAINQLVESVKEKLPVLSTNNDHCHYPQGDFVYKEKIIESLSEINHQIVDISQIAVGQILESNERNFQQLRSTTNQLAEDEAVYLKTIERTMHSCFGEMIKSSEEGVSEILSCCRNLMGYIDNCISELQKEYIKEQRRTNDLLAQIASFCSELINRKTDFEKKIQSAKALGEIVPDSFYTNKYVGNSIVNMFVVVDVSGSMAGEKIESLNNAMKKFIADCKSNTTFSKVELRLSVMTYSSEAKWQYNKPINVVDYDWFDMEASGLTNIGKALKELDAMQIGRAHV